MANIVRRDVKLVQNESECGVGFHSVLTCYTGLFSDRHDQGVHSWFKHWQDLKWKWWIELVSPVQEEFKRNYQFKQIAHTEKKMTFQVLVEVQSVL